MLTNAYIVYIKVNEEYGIEKKFLLLHHDFHEAIATVWINPEYYEKEWKSKHGSMNNTQQTTRKKQQSVPTKAMNVGITQTESSVSSLSNYSNLLTVCKTNGDESGVSMTKSITDKGLSLHESLSSRLNNDLNHFPTETLDKARCTLHRWASKIETTKDVYKCSSCHINLCVFCWKHFHKVPHLLESKSILNDWMKKKETDRKNNKNNK